jgi:hypothetical protein
MKPAPKIAPTHCRHCGKRLPRQNMGKGRKREYCNTAHRHAFWRSWRVKMRADERAAALA